MRVTSAALAAAIVCVALLAGCSGQPSEPTGSSQPQAGSPSNGAGTAAAGPVEAMPTEIRKVQLPAGFPIEVPVPNGRVESASEQTNEGGTGAWTYDLVSEAPAGDLVAWLLRIYSLRGWDLREQTEGPDGSVRLVFVKGGAQSAIKVVPLESGARVQGSIGLDVPVADTL